MADDATSDQHLDPVDLAVTRVFPDGLPATRAAAGTVIVRHFPLTEEHLLRLKAHSESGAVLGLEDNKLARLKRKHHRLAMLLAGGVEPEKAAIACGYHPTTVGILCKDPMFSQLLDLYSDGVEAEWEDTVTRMRELTDELLQELAYRLDNNPEQFTIGQMNEVLKTLADRSGHGPTSTTNLNARIGVVDGAALERLKAAAATARPVDRSLPQLTQAHRGAIEGQFAVPSRNDATQPGDAGERGAAGPSLRAEDGSLVDRYLFGRDADAGDKAA